MLSASCNYTTSQWMNTLAPWSSPVVSNGLPVLCPITCSHSITSSINVMNHRSCIVALGYVLDFEIFFSILLFLILYYISTTLFPLTPPPTPSPPPPFLTSQNLFYCNSKLCQLRQSLQKNLLSGEVLENRECLESLLRGL